MNKKRLLSICLAAGIITQVFTSSSVFANGNESPLFNFKSFDFTTKEITYDQSKPVYMHEGGPQVTIPDEFNNPKEQFRTAWVSTVFNIDIGDVTSDSNLTAEEEFKANYEKVLERYEEYNLNAVTFQVSPMLDAWYKSNIAPWSQYLHSGGSDYKKQGQDPGFGDFDPLTWMIEETHKRGMEFHAWFNPYRVTNNVDKRPVEEKLQDLAENNFARLNPELVYEFQNKLFLNPGRPEVIDYVISRVNEVATKYDVDAIHFDDYFYPYKYSENGKDIIFAEQDIDKQTFIDYNRGFGEYNKENAAKWREDNINILIEGIKNEVSEINSSEGRAIQFGISPFGIWGHSTSQEGGSITPNSSTSSLRDQFANTKKWAQEGWIDYLTPQIYWAFNTSAAPYGELVDWWNRQFDNISNSHLYIGHPNYKYTDASWDSNFKNPYEIPNQLKFNQKYNNVKGSAFFSLRKLHPQYVETPQDKFDILNNSNEILKEEYLNLPSNIPGKPWLDKFETVAVSDANYEKNNDGVKLSWVDNNVDSKFYCIYRQEGNQTEVNINDPKNLIARFGVIDGTEFIDTNIEPGTEYTYAVTVIDKASLESSPTIFNNNEILVQKPENLEAKATDTTVELTWSAPESKVGLEGYVIYKDGKKIEEVSVNTTTYTVTELKTNTIHGFKVTAKYSNGEESKPKSVNARTKK